LGFILLAPIALSLLPTFAVYKLVIHPVETLYIIIAVLYAVCAILIASIHQAQFRQRARPAVTKRLNTQNFEIVSNIWTEMYQGWSFIRRNKQLFLAVIQLSFAGMLLLVIGELATPIVTQLLLLLPNAMAFIFAPAGIGLVAGSIFMPRIVRR